MLDELTGLYYFAARFYDDTTGRFITEDSDNAARQIANSYRSRCA
jgi:RHS repeat-associated protein